MTTPILIAALSGRALSASARQSGFAPLVVDLFADMDTRASAQATRVVAVLSAETTLAALDGLAAGNRPVGVVCGSGFEDQPETLRAIAAKYRLIGNDADTVACAKDPFALAALCRRHAIPHPAIGLRAAAAADDLIKRQGGAGGTHIRPAQAGETVAAPFYCQRQAAGRPAGVLFLADGARALPLAYSWQWTAPEARMPFRYGGAAQPADLPDGVTRDLRAALAKLVPALGLRGLNSADLLVDGQTFVLLEINPRPGATLDLFPTLPLFDWHVQASLGDLPSSSRLAMATRTVGASAAATVYTRHALTFPAGFSWPQWAADRPAPGETLSANNVFCTVLATGGTAEAARALALTRADTLLQSVEEFSQ